MAEENKALVKSSIALARFDPKARNELVVRGLIALAEVRDADLYFFKGEEYRIKGELRQALDNYEKALRIDPKHVDSLFFMGYCHLVVDEPRYMGYRYLVDKDEPRYKRAAKAFQDLINIREKEGNHSRYDFFMYFNLGNAQYSLGSYEEAIESYEQAIELNPEYADSYYMLGVCQQKIGIEHLVLETFEKYLSLDGDKSPGCVEYAKNRVKQLKGITNT